MDRNLHLAQKRAELHQAGGKERIDKQHQQGTIDTSTINHHHHHHPVVITPPPSPTPEP